MIRWMLNIAYIAVLVVFSPWLVFSAITKGKYREGIAAKLFGCAPRLEGLDRDIVVAVMGCAVNGPGEASHADFGVAGGKGEGLLFMHGEAVGKAPMDRLADALMELIEEN